MVTHSSTNRPAQCLCVAERTGCPVFTNLWSYVFTSIFQYILYIKILLATIVLKSLPIAR
jgi:hypothetical protein